MPKNLYTVERDYDHGREQAVGVLVANLGTPEAPTAKALRPYLGEFLSDPRVVEYSRPLWWLILHGIILRVRPKRSAKLYANVWTEQGSPLLTVSKAIADGLQRQLRERFGTPVHCALGMTYGEPSMQRALAELKAKNCRRLVVLPLYPQYSGSTVGSVFDAVAKELTTWRWVPELRTIHQYQDRAGYIAALARRVRGHWQQHGEPERLVTSYHGIPKRYFLNGDPYHCQCHETTRLLVAELGCDPGKVVVTFQSLFGKEEWLKPYTEDTLRAMPGAGIKRVDVMCPGFAADCLETIDEIDREYRHVFLESGGEEYRYLPCLNDDQDHVDLLADLVEDSLGGWVQARSERDDEAAAARVRHSAELASAMAARCPRADAGFGDAAET